MNQVTPQDEFLKRAILPAYEGTVLNYVWINQTPDSECTDHALCSIPLHAMDNAFKNAKRYPKTPTNIWIDYSQLDDSSRFFMESHFFMFAPENVRLRDLNDIPAYKRSPYMKAPFIEEAKDKKIWLRVDLTRLFVLQYCFHETRALNVVYSDFDVPDATLNEKLSRKLKRFGAVFGLCPANNVENSYLAFQRGKGERFLKLKLTPMTMLNNDDSNGYQAFISSFRQLATSEGYKAPQKKLTLRIVPSIGHVMPVTGPYRNFGINKF